MRASSVLHQRGACASVTTRCRWLRLGIALFVSMAVLDAGWAATDDDKRERRQARQAQRKMQVLQEEMDRLKVDFAAEKTTLEMENTRLMTELAALQESTSTAESASVTAQQALQETIGSVRSALEQEQKERAGVATTLATVQGTLATTEVEREGLKGVVARQVSLIDTCEVKNAKLFELNSEVLAKYRGKGILDALKEAEPFTGLADVEAENILQEYRDKLDDQKSN